MKSHPPTRTGPAPARPSLEAKRGAGPGPGPRFDLVVRYYATMKPQRVYPLVVEVPRGRGAVPDDAPTGVTVALRPVVPGAVVVPAELPLEVSRPGARATFQVTPVAKGRLPDARVVVLHGGRPVQELRTRMAARTQRPTRVLLLLAVLLPVLLVRWTSTDPLRGTIPDRRKVIDLGEKKDEGPKPKEARPRPPAAPPLEEAKPPADGPFGPAPVRPEGAKAETARVDEEGYQSYLRDGMPGEVLDFRVRSGLTNNAPEFPGRDALAGWLGAGLGGAYGWLCGVGPDVRPAFWLAAALLVLTFASRVRQRPTRVRRRGSVLLSGASVSATLRAADTAETLPLSPPHGGDEG